MSHEVSQFSNEQNAIALNSRGVGRGTKTSKAEKANKIQIERDMIVGHYLFDGTLHYIKAECLLKWTYRRLETFPALLAAIAKAYKEGYGNGYETGIERDESCVEETTIFKNDFAKAWNGSETKAAIAIGEL